ncbi:pyridoxamine 5'-phosphate oxidase family protein [Actinopolyspora mortivallis]|uniref:Pyridoxamine 5'-phosphate oxidase n=1 Tax=Actinopolyspora mortivallis TaxID=33906 RepID=A0A2T0GRS5_ACTMO|nr:pyridoxamine 5'-phosphate oxidase family protein [Actinopolyspora mortivallis]PRW61800.1 pyridoxamine 5'-phosphate oxidase [Actinopolyspora mortivallis]
MSSWQQFATECPELASVVRGRFEAGTHHVLATLRGDGGPRVSGTEVQFHDGELTLGSMWDAVKARDLRRDRRCALHAHPSDQHMEGGDAKVTAHAVEVTAQRDLDVYRDEVGPPPGPFHLFRLDLREVVHTSVDGEELLIRLWRPGEGVTEFRRGS